MVIAHGHHDHRAHDPQGISVGQRFLNPLENQIYPGGRHDDAAARPDNPCSAVGRYRLAAVAAVPRSLSEATAFPSRRENILQQTALRVSDASLFADPMVIANAEH